MNQRVLVMITSPVGPRLDGVARYARGHGWHLMIQDRLGPEHPFDWPCDGVVATIRRDPRAFAFLRSLVRRGVPVVDLTCDRPAFAVPRVTTDHAAVGRLAAAHFAERGFRNRVFFSVGWGHVQDLRWRGLSEESPAERWSLALERPGAARGGARALARWLEARLAAAPRPLAALTYSQADAAILLAAAGRLGVAVPDELAILSGDDDPLLLENQPVPISAVDTDLGRSAFEAAALLDRLMRGDPPPRRPGLVAPRGIVQRRSTDATVAADPLVRAALAWTAGHLPGRFGAAQLASALGVSRGTLDRRFAAELGRAAGAEIRRQRLALARRLLRETARPVAEIARAAGFSSAAYFCTAFQAETGATPAAWRRANGSGYLTRISVPREPTRRAPMASGIAVSAVHEATSVQA